MTGMFNTMGVMDAIDPAMFRRRRQQPLAYLRNGLSDALLPGIWSRDGVRLSAGGTTVAGVDDSRCSTTTGRLLVPRNDGSYVSLGAQSAFTGLTQFAVVARFIPQDFSALRVIAGFGTGTTSPWILFVNTSAQLSFTHYNGTTGIASTLATTLAAGTEYVIALVFDGTQGTVANRVQLGIAAVTNGVVGVMALTAVGAAGSAASITNDGSALAIGQANSGTKSIAAPVDTVAFYIAQAPSAATINAEIANGYAGSHHRYQFNGTLNDSGTVGGWNGSAAGTGLAYCSDDTRWGGILMGGGGTANPTWDATNRVFVCDGVSQYLRAVGALGVTQDAGIGLVSSIPSTASVTLLEASAGSSTSAIKLATDASKNPVATAPSAVTATGATATGRRVLFGRRTGTSSGIVGVQIGSGAEVTVSGTLTATAVTQLTVGASLASSPATFAALNAAGLFLYAGNFAGKQPIAYPWAQSLGAQL